MRGTKRIVNQICSQPALPYSFICDVYIADCLTCITTSHSLSIWHSPRSAAEMGGIFFLKLSFSLVPEGMAYSDQGRLLGWIQHLRQFYSCLPSIKYEWSSHILIKVWLKIPPQLPLSRKRESHQLSRLLETGILHTLRKPHCSFSM